MMVNEIIPHFQPNIVMLELCAERIGSFIQPKKYEISLSEILKSSFQERSLKQFCIGLFSWMQNHAGTMLGSDPGGELTAAIKSALSIDSAIVLADRNSDITIQRIIDKLSIIKKAYLLLSLLWDCVSLSVHKLVDYMRRVEDDTSLIDAEIKSFTKHFPEIAEILINERDEYIAQSIIDVIEDIRSSCGDGFPICVVAVVGSAHLNGIQKNIANGGISRDRIKDILTSSCHSPDKQIHTYSLVPMNKINSSIQ
jgi:pheromone shutdown protein TraB